ncbi:hypothetical protein CYANOKiyG1_74020 [Okeania sp. KiyG1]|nr:hypothetical protein CYANOKiyG1_74020 [Okeania sp. KiyG1]
MNGRTYCGHYRGHYLKSTLEYIYARYLDYKEIHWEYEVKIFDLSTGGSYKPDFMLSDGSYVEVKGGFNYQTDLPRIKCFEKDYGVTVKIIQEKDLRQLIASTPMVYEHLKQEWKQIAKGLGMDTSGKNNSRYGAKVSNITRAKISAKAKSRMKDSEYKSKWLEGRKNSAKVQKQNERLKAYNLLRQYQVFVTCHHCGKEFEVLFRKNKPQKYCSYSCSNTAQFSKISGDKSFLIQELALDFAKNNAQSILSCKVNKIISVLKPFYDQIEKEFGIKDERTVSKALLGYQTNRKEILFYFHSLVENVLGTTGK